MSDQQQPTPALVIRLATPEDIEQIDYLDSFGTSPTREIHRDLDKYFGSVDPSTHEHTLIFLLEIDGSPVGKAQLMLPPQATSKALGYLKPIVDHPNSPGKQFTHNFLTHIIPSA